MDSLIQVYNNTLPSDFCKFVIEHFERSQDSMIDGISGGQVNKGIKDSKDIMIVDASKNDMHWQFIYDYLRENLLTNAINYLRQNPFCFINSSYSSELSLIATAAQRFGAMNNGVPHMQMQRYINDQGYYAWHHENEGGNTSKRELFFIYYLNSVSGGETEFKFNPLKVGPQEGNLIIAPAYWTHKHRGNPPGKGNKKYIITGWIEKKDSKIFEEFEEDYLI